jgi:hypothetical protein
LEYEDTKKAKQQMHSSEVENESALLWNSLSYIDIIKASSTSSERPATGPCPESDTACLHSINAEAAPNYLSKALGKIL